MELKINWPDGATHFCPAFGRYETRAYKKDGDVWHRWTGFDWHELRFPPVVSVLRQLIKRPSSVNGGGERFPPIGVLVEARFPKSDDPTWYPLTLLYLSEETAVIKTTYEACYTRAAFEKMDIEFRTLRTPEQMAAEEHAAKVSTLMHDAGITDSAFADDPEALVWAESLLSAGWVKPCEQ